MTGMAVSEVRFAADLLTEICREEALTMLVIEHDMSLVFRFAQRITGLSKDLYEASA